MTYISALTCGMVDDVINEVKDALKSQLTLGYFIGVSRLIPNNVLLINLETYPS